MSYNATNNDLLIKAFGEAILCKKAIEDRDIFEDLLHMEQRYDKSQLLGEGAAKKVWLAYDKFLDRKVAFAQLKNINSNELNDFINEARLASTLKHPYIAPIYDFGFSEDKVPYFIMPLYEGRSLYDEQMARQQQDIPLKENLNWTLSIFLKVCQAVSFAHSKGILHLDIKPSNIRVDDYGEVLLCDWGIAKSLFSQPSSSTGMANSTPISRSTLLGEVKGTPGFMAPEQTCKDSKSDARADIYGLGALLHCMITGEPPLDQDFYGKTHYPFEVQAILQKAIAKEAADRYQNVKNLISDIEKYRNGMVTIAENASSWSVLKKWLIRHQKSVSIIIINLIILSTLLVVYITGINKSKAHLQGLVEELKSSKKQKEKHRLETAAKYYQQSLLLYRNTVSKFDFDSRDNHLANEMIVRSLELNPDNSDAWALSGTLRTFKHEYKKSAKDFQKAGPKYNAYYQLLKDFIEEDNRTSSDGQLKLIKEISQLNDLKFRSHLIFKNIYERKGQELFNFSLKALAIVNKNDSLKWTYDAKTKELDLSKNALTMIYPIRTLSLNKLNLSHTKLNDHQLQHLRGMSLRSVNLSYTTITSLKRFLNPEVEELNLEGCAIEDLSSLSFSKVRKLNIYKTKALLKSLKSTRSLKHVTCSKEQANQLKSILRKTVKYTIAGG